MDNDWDRLGRLKPSEKVALCLEMTEACFLTCAAGIRSQNLDMTDEEVIEKFQERIDWIKQSRKRGKSRGNANRVH